MNLDRCWSWQRRRPGPSADAAGTEPEHPARKYMQTTQRPAYFNVRIQSLALSVAHYVLRTTDEHNPYWSCNTQGNQRPLWHQDGVSSSRSQFVNAATEGQKRTYQNEPNILDLQIFALAQTSINNNLWDIKKKKWSKIKMSIASDGSALFLLQSWLWLLMMHRERTFLKIMATIKTIYSCFFFWYRTSRPSPHFPPLLMRKLVLKSSTVEHKIESAYVSAAVTTCACIITRETGAKLWF